MSPVEFGNPVVRERTKPVRMLSARPPVAAQTTGDEPRATSQPASPIEATIAPTYIQPRYGVSANLPTTSSR